jgi:RimJ/RimL family protein N-acetyltransferase
MTWSLLRARCRRSAERFPDSKGGESVVIIGERQVMERELGHAMWAVEDKATGAFVGQCGLRPVDEGAGPEIDLAYHFIRASWGKGYGTEAAVAVLAHGLGPVGLDCIMADVVPQNVGSWRVMEKAGMRYAGLVDYYGLEKYVAAREWWRRHTPDHHA